jgi:hypothetical protein
MKRIADVLAPLSDDQRRSLIRELVPDAIGRSPDELTRSAYRNPIKFEDQHGRQVGKSLT